MEWGGVKRRRAKNVANATLRRRHWQRSTASTKVRVAYSPVTSAHSTMSITIANIIDVIVHAAATSVYVVIVLTLPHSILHTLYNTLIVPHFNYFKYYTNK